MPSRPKKSSDRDAIWNSFRDLQLGEVNRQHAEFLYKITTVLPRTTNNNATAAVEENGVPTVVCTFEGVDHNVQQPKVVLVDRFKADNFQNDRETQVVKLPDDNSMLDTLCGVVRSDGVTVTSSAYLTKSSTPKIKRRIEESFCESSESNRLLHDSCRYGLWWCYFNSICLCCLVRYYYYSLHCYGKAKLFVLKYNCYPQVWSTNQNCSLLLLLFAGFSLSFLLAHQN